MPQFYIKFSNSNWRPLLAHVGKLIPTMKACALICIPHSVLLHYTT